MNYEDIKRHFENTPPPKEVKWTDWANITDTQLFLKSCYIGIRNFNGTIDRCPAWWHLRDFYILIKKTVPQNTIEEITTETIPQESTATNNEETVPEKVLSEAEATI
jgi:hypothetical protein